MFSFLNIIYCDTFYPFLLNNRLHSSDYWPDPMGYYLLPIFPIQRDVSSYPSLQNNNKPSFDPLTQLNGIPSLTSLFNPTNISAYQSFPNYNIYFYTTTPIQRDTFHYQFFQSNETSLPTQLSQTSS